MIGKPQLRALCLLTVTCVPAVICLCPASPARADWLATLGERHCFGWLLPRPELSPHHADQTRRAGDPFCISKYARDTYGPAYRGYYVGGGAALHGIPATRLRGEPRYLQEGTFGVDYDPPWSRVMLWWFHGRRHQGGEGQYEPDEKNNPFE